MQVKKHSSIQGFIVLYYFRLTVCIIFDLSEMLTIGLNYNATNFGADGVLGMGFQGLSLYSLVIN